MQELYENISYLRGLLNGLNYDDNSKDGKMFKAIIDTLEGIVDAVNCFVPEGDQPDEFECVFTCPNCTERIEIDPNVIENEELYVCPNCGEQVTIFTSFEL